MFGAMPYCDSEGHTHPNEQALSAKMQAWLTGNICNYSLRVISSS